MPKSIYKSLLLTFGLISLQGCYSFAGPTSIGISATPAPGTENLVLLEPENYKSIKATDIQQLKFPSSNEFVNCDFGFTYFSGSSSSWTASMGRITNPTLMQIGITIMIGVLHGATNILSKLLMKIEYDTHLVFLQMVQVTFLTFLLLANGHLYIGMSILFT